MILWGADYGAPVILADRGDGFGSNAEIETETTLGFCSTYGHFTTGGIDDRIESTLPPVLRPNTVPRS
jgi:hypothetical protein